MKGLNLFRKDTRSRIVALALATVMALSGIPSIPAQAEENNTTVVATVADPETLHRPIDIYGQNTLNAGKITVGKSVDTTGFGGNTLDGVSMGNLQPDTNNFLVTLSQSAQAVGLASKLPVPIDAVFILDTSGSMESPSNDPRYENMIDAANEAIASLLAANDQNRVAVVAFSSADYGEGTSNNAAANVLSELAHYDGEAATAHLKRVDSEGAASSDGIYVAGRKEITTTTTEWQQVQVGTDRWGRPEYEWQNIQVSKTVNAFRRAEEGGTNIQAGIALGASLLMDSSKSTTAVVNGKTVTRMPFIIVLSDGNPTFSATATNWYESASIAAAGEQGPGSAPYAGNGFLAAMTAAYYKSAITERYFGTNANEDNHCNIYTVGVDLESNMTDSETALAKITLNPAEEYKSSNSWYTTFRNYWNSYNEGNAFNINVGKQEWSNRADSWVYSDSNFNITAASISASKNYVNGKNSNGTSMFTGGLRYNDDYFNSKGDAESLNNTFKELVRLIQIKAISIPTDTSVSADFGGYVHFYDPIGEYMEVKDVHGIVADGYFFQGASFAKNMVNYDTSNADADFDAAITMALNGRLELSESTKLKAEDIKAVVAAAKAADGQLYYNSNEDYENSFCWWGSAYTDDAKDEHVQFLGFAQDDSIEYIENALAAGNIIPADADYVCRSYYYYGTAGGTIEPIDDFLLMVIRVQRSLVAPYQETVYVSIPGSLLSVDRVLITEDHTQNPVTYEAFVQAENPVRVIYEVGLQSDINAQNVAQKLAGSAYVAEKTNKNVVVNGKDNYEAAEDTYYFYTNDWDRSKSGESHERALAHAGFDVAEDNDFYVFLEDTLLYTDTNGTPATSLTTGATYYYKRPYYEWTNATAKNEEKTLFACTPKETYIAVKAPSQEVIDKFAMQKDGQWYVKVGTYTGYSLSAANDDTVKSDNATGTSTIVAHPMRTNAEHDSHYTVFLGNNGRLALKADKTKTVQINADAATQITDNDGNLITVGDVLTYTIKVVNSEETAANAVVMDTIPAGTELVADSITQGGVYDATNKIITWNLSNISAGGTVNVAFEVEVTPEALSQDVITVDNTATIQIGNNPAYTTNTVENPPHGKLAESTDGTVNPGTIQVGDELTYRINYYNNEDTMATVTITDIIPAGTTYIANSATHSSQLTEVEDASGKTTELKWEMSVQPNTGGYVSFKVVVDESAKTTVTNGATIKIGENEYTTNTTSANVLSGDLKLTKTVEVPSDFSDDETTAKQAVEFTLKLTTFGAQESGYGVLNGTYTLSGSTRATQVEFVDGVANVTIKHGETLTIKDLPAGVRITVTEENVPAGYKATYTTAQTVEVVPSEVGVTAVAVGVKNTYSVEPMQFQLKGTKSLATENGAYLEESTFSIVAYNADEEWDEVSLGTSAEPKVGTDNPNTTVNESTTTALFGVKEITKAGTYRFIIRELNTGLAGVTYDDTQYRLALVVVDNGGRLGIDYSASSLIKVPANSSASPLEFNDLGDLETNIVFNNSYAPKEVTLKLGGTKTLVGRDLQANKYSFLIRELDVTNNQAGDVVASGTNISTTDGTNKTIEFSDITYVTAGMYTYQISETVLGENGIVYDDNVYILSVVVKDESGQLAIDYATSTLTKVPKEGASSNHTFNTLAELNSQIAFSNTYTPDEVAVTLYANKQLEIRDLNDVKIGTTTTMTAGLYRFQIKDVNGKVLATGSNDANGLVTFENVYFNIDDVGTPQKLYVSEIVPEMAADPSIAYSTAVIEVTVNVTYNSSNGLLSATVDKNAGDKENTEVIITNIDYPDSIEVTPVAWKTTTAAGGTLPTEATFSFSIVDENNEVVHSGTAPVGSTTEAVNFIPMHFSDVSPEGGWNYWIVESNVAGVNNGIKYDDVRYRMNVVITRSEGRLHQSVKYYTADGTEITDTNNIIFENEYNATGYINLTATKVLKHRTLNAGEFVFELKRIGRLNTTTDGNNNTIPVADNTVEEETGGGVIEGTNVAGEANSDTIINFPTLYYSSADLGIDDTVAYVLYEMKEVVPTNNRIAGVTYDTRIHNVIIKLEHDANDTNIISASVYSVDGKTNFDSKNSNTGIVFTNSYSAGTPISIPVTKTLNGRTMRDGEFEFGLYNASGTLVDTATNKDGVVTFSRTIPATTPADTYTYTIEEIEGHIKGIKYNTAKNKYTVKVIVSYDNQTGKQSVEVVNEAGNELTENEISFVNEYTATSTVYTPVALKTLTGRSLINNEFSFTVYEMTESNGTYAESSNVVSTGLAKNTTDAGGNNVVFTPIIYNDTDGTNTVAHYYVIKENHGSMGGIDYSKVAPVYLKVVVQDDGNGKLGIVSSRYYSDDEFTESIEKPVFENIYKALGTTVKLEATKTLTGRDMATAEFDIIVRELQDGNATNTFITGNDVKLVGDNVAATANEEGVAKAAVNFAEIGYSTAGTYTYMMSELAPPSGKINGITFDPTMYKVTVVVADNQNGKLEVKSVAYEKLLNASITTENNNSILRYADTEALNTVPSFINEYAPEATEPVKIDVFKDLIGKDLKAEEFTFILKDSKGQAVAYASNGSNNLPLDKATFELTFSEPGLKTYTIEEQKSVFGDENATNKNLYDFDKTVYTVVIDVTDNGKGKLEYATTYYKGSVAAANKVTVIDFINTYTPPTLVEDLSLAIKATKTVTSPNGYELEEGDFTFTVKDVYGNEVATGKNIAPTGTDKSVADIEFSDFTFTQPGEYRYWITENPTDKLGITIDNRSWEVHVTVSYAYDDILVENSSEVLYPAGTLYIADGAVKTYASSRALELEAPAFVNIYTPAFVSLTITADKILTVPEGSERKLQANEFTFRVKDENGIIRAESHNDADGNITFHFTENVVGEHTYTVIEYVPAVNANGIYYDKENKAVITVEVVDDGEGQLKIAEATVNGSAVTLIEPAAEFKTKDNVATFTNKYAPTAATTTITAKKVLHGAELTAGAFKFELVDRTQNKVVETVTNDADGMITFTQTFDKIGQYPFLIREVKGTDANVTYDTTEYALVVDVKDNLVGQLVATVDFQREAVFENTFTPPVEPTPEPGEDDGRIYKSFAFTKVWDDNNNAKGKRPDSITVELYQDGVYVTDVILSKENGWTDTAILMYSKDDHVYEWTMKEKNVPAGYVASYNQSEYTVINTLKELSTVTNGPGTGDDSNLGFFLGVAAVSLIAIIGLIVLMKFRKKDDV